MYVEEKKARDRQMFVDGIIYVYKCMYFYADICEFYKHMLKYIVYVYIYKYVYLYTYIYVYIYIHICIIYINLYGVEV
jgi:hypothetical protein